MRTCRAELPDMKIVELKPREFHRRIGWALPEARRGMAVVITAPVPPAVTRSIGRSKPGKSNQAAGQDWEAHFGWLKSQPRQETNPVDDLRVQERR